MLKELLTNNTLVVISGGYKLLTQESRHTSDIYKDPEVTKDLQALYNELLKSAPGFPYGSCEVASKRVQDLKREFFVAHGYFYVDAPGLSKYKPHFFCVDKDRVIVDLTASQFNIYMYPANTIPKGILVLKPDNPLYNRYVLGDGS